MDINSCLKQLQAYLANTPLVVLGSGASAAFGMPTMSDLAAEITNRKQEFSDDESIQNFFKDLASGIDLETVLGMDQQMLNEDSKLIRKVVWETINSKDKFFFNNILQNGFENFYLVDLLKKLLEPTPHIVDVITTNYDRLAEYASDIVKANVITGYEGSYYKLIEMPSSNLYSRIMRERKRTINLWKVHGSLDWFMAPTGEMCALSHTESVPDNYLPNIVPPGRSKYKTTHFEPYRFIMAQADKAIGNAESFLVFGYGFNDDHIQPKIIEEIRKKKPIVVVTKKATSACLNLLQQTSNANYMIIEEKDSKTHVVTNSSDDLYEEDFWTMRGFIEKW